MYRGLMSNDILVILHTSIGACSTQIPRKSERDEEKNSTGMNLVDSIQSNRACISTVENWCDFDGFFCELC